MLPAPECPRVTEQLTLIPRLVSLHGATTSCRWPTGSINGVSCCRMLARSRGTSSCLPTCATSHLGQHPKVSAEVLLSSITTRDSPPQTPPISIRVTAVLLAARASSDSCRPRLYAPYDRNSAPTSSADHPGGATHATTEQKIPCFSRCGIVSTNTWCNRTT